MKKTYVYEPPFYQIEVTAVGVLCAAVLVACIWMAVANVGIGPGLSAIVGIVCFYQVWNTFVSLSNPERVIVDEKRGHHHVLRDTVREDTYVISELKRFLVEARFPSSGQDLRSCQRSHSHLPRDATGCPTKMFNDSRELFDFPVATLNTRCHPGFDQGPPRATSTRKYIDHADQIKAIEEAAEGPEKRQRKAPSAPDA